MNRLPVAFAVAAALAACYSPNIGVQQCGPNGACAGGYVCAADNHCYKIGHVPSFGDMAGSSTGDMPMGDLAMACTPASCKNSAKPICDPMSNACVECEADGDCPSGKVCASKACVPGCTAMHGCPDGGGSCDPNKKMCERCAGDGDCTDPKLPRCEPQSGLCMECLPTNDNCTNGKFCGEVNGVYVCQAGCQKNLDCAATTDGGMQMMLCCNHVCTDGNVDGKNCGGCGTSCANQTCCGAICSDLSKDLSNCGMCGALCIGKNATWSCMTSMCAVTGCNGGFGDCNLQASDGCEAKLASDVNNCMACGNKCTGANAVMACMNNACAIASCANGFGNCNNQVGDGCEVNTAGDLNNCGGCGSKCAPANGTGACVASTCLIASCNAGFGDCNNNVGDGCEVNTNVSVPNCGGCGMACPGVPNANSGCAAGKCTIASCIGVFKDCDGTVANGCEVNPTSDINNCNGCGLKCTPGANVAAMACVASACKIASCNAGFADCDGAIGTGCEVNTNSDKNHCGNCNTVCGNNQTCTNGACVNNMCSTLNAPAFTTAISGWAMSGIQFHALRTSTLVSFSFYGQSHTNTIRLVDVTAGNAVIGTVAVPANVPIFSPTVNWPLVVGHTYQLTNDLDDGMYVFTNVFPTVNVQISVDGTWGMNALQTGFWFSYTNINTCG